MVHRIWEEWAVHNLRAAETASGKKVIEDYSGMHRPKNAGPGWVENHKRGDKAVRHVDATKRRSLNQGDDFSGFLVRRPVGHVFLYIGTHPVHGVSAVVDVPSSHTENKVQILIGDTSQNILLGRNEFFGQLKEEPTQEDAVDEICQAYYTHHIAMEK